MKMKRLHAELLKNVSLFLQICLRQSPTYFYKKNHPLATKKSVSLKDLEEYPRLNFVQD